MSLVALSTAGGDVAVARLDAGPWGVDCEAACASDGRTGSESVLGLLRHLARPQEFRPKAGIDAIAFEAGPGTFTGLRIGCALAQGLALAHDLPLVPVGTLEAIAWRSAREHGMDRANVLVVNDARMGEVYAAVCEAGRADDRLQEGLREARVRLLAGPRLADPRMPPSFVPSFGAGTVLWAAGDAWHRLPMHAAWRDLVTGGLAQVQASIPAASAQACAVAELALGLYRQGRCVDAAEAAPRYLRDRVALDVDEQARLRGVSGKSS